MLEEDLGAGSSLTSLTALPALGKAAKPPRGGSAGLNSNPVPSKKATLMWADVVRKE